MEITQLKVSPREEEGIWFEHGGAQFRVCSLHKPAYKKALQDKLKPHRRQIRRGSLGDDTMDKITIEAVAEHLLVDWKGLTENGQPVPYSKVKAVDLLTAMPKFQELIADFASDAAAFETEADQEGVENLKNV